MNMPQFQVSLLSPTSTSVQIQVAMKFSGDSGIIIEFSNERAEIPRIKGLDASFLSRFKEEDERHVYMYYFFKFNSSSTSL